LPNDETAFFDQVLSLSDQSLDYFRDLWFPRFSTFHNRTFFMLLETKILSVARNIRHKFMKCGSHGKLIFFQAGRQGCRLQAKRRIPSTAGNQELHNQDA
jgi:hypothetical protein